MNSHKWPNAITRNVVGKSELPPLMAKTLLKIFDLYTKIKYTVIVTN